MTSMRPIGRKGRGYSPTLPFVLSVLRISKSAPSRRSFLNFLPDRSAPSMTSQKMRSCSFEYARRSSILMQSVSPGHMRGSSPSRRSVHIWAVPLHSTSKARSTCSAHVINRPSMSPGPLKSSSGQQQGHCHNFPSQSMPMDTSSQRLHSMKQSDRVSGGVIPHEST